LDIVVLKNKADGDDAMDVDDVEVLPPTDPEDARQFSQVISGLQKSYPRDKMEDINTSFRFICLLHLANEQGLKLESATESNVFVEKGLVEDEDENFMSLEKQIGNIWDIKIYRDPNAHVTQAA